jgi:HemY protein
MKRLYVIVFLVIAATAALGLAIAEHSGYVLIAYKSFRYESSLWATLALMAVLWLLIWGIKALVELVMASSGVVNPWSRRNRSRRVQVAIEQGQLDLAEGRWASAQRHLHAPPRPSASRCCITSARPARQRARQVRGVRQLLERALERQPQADWRLP